MDKVSPLIHQGNFQEKIFPTKFAQSFFKQVQRDSRKDKQIRETEKIIRAIMRELPRGTELYALEIKGQLFNDKYPPGTKVTKISMAKHFMCVKLPDGLITQMHYKQLGTDDIQVIRKLLEA